MVLVHMRVGKHITHTTGNNVIEDGDWLHVTTLMGTHVCSYLRAFVSGYKVVPAIPGTAPADAMAGVRSMFEGMDKQQRHMHRG